MSEFSDIEQAVLIKFKRSVDGKVYLDSLTEQERGVLGRLKNKGLIEKQREYVDNPNNQWGRRAVTVWVLDKEDK